MHHAYERVDIARGTCIVGLLSKFNAVWPGLVAVNIIERINQYGWIRSKYASRIETETVDRTEQSAFDEEIYIDGLIEDQQDVNTGKQHTSAR